MSEVAFLFMDLTHRGRGDLAWRFLNQYVAATGDYAGLEVFRFYAVYRAVVRAKIHLIESSQRQQLVPARQRCKGAFREYLALAGKLSQPPAPALVIAHGLSGSGKTTATLSLIEQLGAIRLRSDVERKRLHGFAAMSSSGSGIATGIYTREATAATYRRLGELARLVLGAGYSVVVDAAFLKRTEREAFRLLAETAGVPFAILDFRAPLEVLRARVAERSARADDASEAGLTVLERQVATREPFTPAEMAVAVAVDGTGPVAAATWEPFKQSLRRLAVGTPPARRPDRPSEPHRG
jgi:predicted kinase